MNTQSFSSSLCQQQNQTRWYQDSPTALHRQHVRELLTEPASIPQDLSSSLTLGWAMAGATPLLQGSQVFTRPFEIRFGRLLGEHSLLGGKIITEGGRSKSCAIPLPTHHIVFLQQSYSRGFLWCQTTWARRGKKKSRKNTASWKCPVCSFPQALARRSLKSYTCKKI